MTSIADMAIEIERKFLLRSESWRDEVSRREEICQAYLSNSNQASVRIRIHGELANINIKSRTLGVQRSEYEYPIPLEEAREMVSSLCNKQIIKTRHYVEYERHTWEIDEFHGDNQGLVVAELELGTVNEHYSSPEWLGKEVTDEERYYNIALIEKPFREWGREG